ncbi:hypothetical protein [Pseudorhizobium flavum]|uniref:Uncharacterized protein n=1 Tax=Pseudorhizobium flavum TaxID=1335061 RepID=A0A7W9Z2F5_9HYPH|nr:hypothetical protein [Pseudorhizobium flavum]MBB6182279.1 hypothetical protein [Pseudorhizobium flavum]
MESAPASAFAVDVMRMGVGEGSTDKVGRADLSRRESGAITAVAVGDRR